MCVVGIEGGHIAHERLKTLGIRAGIVLEKTSGRGRAPVVVRHGRSTTALGFGVSRKILVKITS